MKQKMEKQSTIPPKELKATVNYPTLTPAEKTQEVMKSVCGADPITYNGKEIQPSIGIIVD